jgi:hypothetical protein
MRNGVVSAAYQVESRGWLAGEHGTEPGSTPSATLDLSLFTEADHYPDGYIKSGIVVGKVTASGLYGPYDPAAVDGREAAAGLLFDSETVESGQTQATNALLVHGFVNEARLPYSGVTGAIDAAGKADLAHIIWY